MENYIKIIGKKIKFHFILIFRYDLQLFDYDPEPFYNIVRNAAKKIE